MAITFDMLELAPRLSAAVAERLARELYGVVGTAASLPSERDQNFRIVPSDVSTGAGAETAFSRPFVLKVANAKEDGALLRAQRRALEHIGRAFPLVPRVLHTVAGNTLTEINEGGRTHAVWAVSELDGLPMGTIAHRSSDLLLALGEATAGLTRALAGFDDPAIHREFHWDLTRGREIIAQYRSLVGDASLGATVDAVLNAFEQHTAPRLQALRKGAVHNDLNDYNVLVRLREAGQPDAQPDSVSGIVDFGDMVWGYTVADLAIAAAYALLDARDPLSGLAQMVRTYHAAFPLTEAEAGALYGLLTLRLCMSVCIGAHQQRERPDNAYLGVSQHAVARMLPRLARVPLGFAEATVREACGWEPVASSDRVRSWLQTHRASFAPVLGVDWRVERPVVLDLSVASPLVHGEPGENTEPSLTQRIRAVVAQAVADGRVEVSAEDRTGAAADRRARVAVGRYDEPRLLYTAPFFAAGDGTLDERRTVHLGLDLFADAGTPVHAPFDATIHAFGDHHQVQDYGPSIVLRHEVGDDRNGRLEFFTLYGHLSRASLEGKRAGQRIKRGERFATLGTPEENVGWPPHLHLQIVTDMLGLGADFPGVGTAGRRGVWRSVSPDANLVANVPDDCFGATPLSTADVLEQRRTYVGANLSLSYEAPVRVARGFMQYLYDSDGRRYIDAYNNVPHVGHGNPYVVRAVADQLAVLNTNTRYLHDHLGAYAERLASTLPAPLRVCFVLNSASEANELAVRLARASTRGRDMIVLEAAYHGNTNTLIDLSPYKHAGPGGGGTPEWVHVAPIADCYRGAYKRANPRAGALYADHVAAMIEALTARGRRLAGFMAETCPSVGGQIIFPPEYLQHVYLHVRAAGGVCIADEVQTGLGRIGTHMWAFEAQHVVPDIVVMGKPLGNGYPLAAVVTTRAIADAFDNGMEFFSTFGGTTAACAAGLAVLDVMRDEQLQAHALRCGEHLLDGLRDLQARHALIGDVRGSGLFIGVELVRDRATLEPASAEASYVANRMREEGVLLGTDGPHDNVIKIRPPMPFTNGDADYLLGTLDRVLDELDARRRVLTPA
jgi:4-aminobutyrate aminotransferase-like enzyme/Ser/Thr protein kinase RdoA (MazF antagonist)/murein DD-endopeptidase MepM/ murein hydrolase activator NlpD